MTFCFFSTFVYSSEVEELVPLYTGDEGEGVPNEFLVAARIGRFYKQLSEIYRNSTGKDLKQPRDKQGGRTGGSRGSEPKRLGEFARYLLEKSGVEIVKEYRIGRWVAAWLRANSSVIDQIRQYTSEIDFIETNHKVRALSDGRPGYRVLKQSVATPLDVFKYTDIGGTDAPETEANCFRQSTGDTFWGLGRISSRSKPSYRSATYRYTDQDDGTGVDIYVLDSGVYADHNEFEGRVISQYTAGEHEAEGSGDKNGHGTHVASICAGRQVGVAKAANIISVKVLDSEGRGTSIAAIEGLEYAVEQIKAEAEMLRRPTRAVINLSLGADTGIYAMDAAVKAVVREGIPVVVAAGNSYVDACNSSPARVREAITVGATGNADTFASFSNYGSCVDILAPGQNIVGAFIGSTSTLASAKGTSQAAPFVAGVVARYLSSFDPEVEPLPSVEQIRHYVISTATRDVVALQGSARNTPNRLLFKACDGEPDAGIPLKTSHLSLCLGVLAAVVYTRCY